MTLAHETIVFLYSLLLGAGVGVVYDVFRVLRLTIGRNRFVVFGEDLLFFAVAAGGTFLFCLEFCQGQLRLFVLLGEGLGFLLYFFTAGELVIHFFRWVIEWIGKLFQKLWQLLAAPLIRKTKRIFHRKTIKKSQNSQKMKKHRFFQKFFLQHKQSLLYNKHNKQKEGSAGK